MICLVYLLIFFTSNIYAVLEKVRILTDSSRKIILFSDYHPDHPQEDAQQLECFTRTLQNRTHQHIHPLDILIEEPIDLSSIACCPKVTTRLSGTMSRSAPSNIVFEDIEIRRASTLAAMIMDSKDDPRWFSPGYGCDEYTFGSVSFVDIFNEWAHHLNYLQQNQEFIKKRIGNFCLQLLMDEIFVHQEILIDNIHALMIRPDEPILNTAKRLFGMQQIVCEDGTIMHYDQARNLLLDNITSASGALLDLYLVHRILMLPETHDIMVIAGSRHADVVSFSLTGWLKSRYNPLKFCENHVPRNSMLTPECNPAGLSTNQIVDVLKM